MIPSDVVNIHLDIIFGSLLWSKLSNKDKTITLLSRKKYLASLTAECINYQLYSVSGPTLPTNRIRHNHSPPPREVLPYMGYVSMCGPKGYSFSTILVMNRVWFLHSSLDIGIFFKKKPHFRHYRKENQ